MSAPCSLFRRCPLLISHPRSVVLRRLLVLAAVLVLAASCSQKTRIDYHPGPRADQPGRDAVVDKLLSHYRQWRSVPYQIGGTSREGVDCSAFVALTFRQHFDIELPRTTDELSGVGRQVTPAATRPGDLLLFKTGLFARHAGIAVGKGRFIHASTSQGVMLSALDEPYWHQRLWQVRRVLN